MPRAAGPKSRYDQGMGILVRAVISGFGLALGAAVYRKVARQLGLDEPDADKERQAERDGVASGVNPPGDAGKTAQA